MIKRRVTKEIKVGNLIIGGNYPVAVQSMTTTKTEDVESTVKQILDLEAVGCDVVRVAVPTMEAAAAIKEIKKQINIPLVADIHFDYRLAIESIKNGADKIRINPGNIGSEERIVELIGVLKEYKVPVRIGVNSGSLEKEYKEAYGVTPKAMVESIKSKIEIFERNDFYDIILSLKSSDVDMSVQAYRMISKEVDYPLHVGVTEAGTPYMGTIKSSIGIGSLLLDGIGDTIRVSLTGDPVEEIKVGLSILKSIGLKRGLNIVSCPTCGRCKIDLIGLADRVEQALEGVDKELTLAIMGCAVNGPGEASEADLGIAGGNGEALLFKKGKIVKKIKEEDIENTLLEELDKL